MLTAPRIQVSLFCHIDNRIGILTLLVLLLSSPALGQSSGSDSTQEEEQAAPNKSKGFVVIPALFYTPETSLAFGGSVMYYYRDRNSALTSRPSYIQPVLIYTLKKQIIIHVASDFYWNDEAHQVIGEATYRKFPDRFYGIGPDVSTSYEKYTPRSAIFLAHYFRRVYAGLRLGGLLDASYFTIDAEEGGLLQPGIIPGSTGGFTSGLGGLVNWDTRDNTFYPTKGMYHLLTATFFGNAFGSDYAFSRFMVDLRAYARLHERHALAFQVFLNSTTGTPPFYMLPQLGGTKIMRGYYQGRFRDQHALAFQAEYRTLVWWRLGLVGFIGIGDVAPSLGDFNAASFKSALGIGFRFLYDKNEKVNVRVDFALTGDTPGPYISIREAF